MRHLLALLCCLFPATAIAEYKVAFGESDLTPETPHHVTGPLLQLQSAGGTTLSFQHNSRFIIGTDNRITLLSGNLRVGPAGGDMLLLTLPQGPATVAPLTALTVTASAAQASGKVYQGQLILADKTFQTGQGFVLTRTGAQATFTPAPAQAPQPTTVANQSTQPATPPEEPQAPTPEPEEDPQQPQPQPEPTPNPEPDPHPEPQPEPQPEPEPEPTPQPQPEPELPAAPTLEGTATLGNTVIGFSRDMTEGMAANATHTTLTLEQYNDGTFTPLSVLTSRYGTNSTRLLRGTAELAERSSHGVVAGIARWVGGSQMVVKGGTVTELANSLPSETETPTNLSLHTVWGEKGVAPSFSGTLTYTLAAATQPTYTSGADSTGATFTGNLSITFNKGYSGALGHYDFEGQVSMPTGETATNYTMATTAPTPFNAAAFTSPGTLQVTSSQGAAACPSGTCTGSVNIAGFGNGMTTAGALYSINAHGTEGIEGAALFTAQP